MYTLLVTGDVPGASTYFNPLLQQTVIPCTSGTRPGSPNGGMLVWETDTGRYSSYSTAFAAWVTMGQVIVSQYTPTLTATTTNPNIGSTGTAEARYTLFNGKFCFFRGSIQWGGAGVTSGTGQYFIQLPFTSSNQIANGVSTVGNIMLRDDSASPILRTGACYIAAGATTFGMFEATTGLVQHNVPWTWGSVGGYISFSMTYEFA